MLGAVAANLNFAAFSPRLLRIWRNMHDLGNADPY